MSRALVAAPVASVAFVAVLALAAIAVQRGFVADDTLRLWAGASTTADGGMTIGRIVAGYPTFPFLATTLVAWIAPAGTPAPALVAAGVFALIATFLFGALRNAGFSRAAAVAITPLLMLHPAMLRAVVAGPADVILAAFLLMFGLALYDLRARSDTPEVMRVGLALMALAFSHPVGAVFAFASVPFLAFAVRPTLVANSALNIVIALVFPAMFMVAAFSYVSWVFPGDGWSFFAAPAESLSLWTVAVARILGHRLTGVATIDASLTMAVACVAGAPIAAVMIAMVRRRRPLVDPAIVFTASALAATAICVSSGFFGEPAAMIVAAPVLAATVLIRVPLARERAGFTIALLLCGWLGGFVSLALVDPITVSQLRGATHGSGERLDTVAAGGAAAADDGVLTDTDNAPAFVLGRGRARGLLGAQSEPFALAMLFARIDTPFVAVPDPQSVAGANDRLDKAFPRLFRDGLADYRVVYQNNTWRIFGRIAGKKTMPRQ